MGLAQTFEEQLFSQIHGKNLVYNTCWEDPRCDRELLQLDRDSQIVMLTSAGCNALDYLLDDPAQIHCVDLNPRQNALLDLKKALFLGANYTTLFDFFGFGTVRDGRAIFENALLPHLQAPYSRQYWERNLHFFNGKGLRKSFYWYGSSGAVAWLIRQWLQRQPETRRLIHALITAESVAEQRAWYEQLEPQILNRFLRWFIRQHFVQSMLGVPKTQQHLAAAYYPEGMAGYIRQCFRHVFTQLSLRDNYFWKLYLHGHYTVDCCPNYLKIEHFATLKDRVARIRTHTTSLSDFLKLHPGQYSHFVLLDHQDWLAAHLRPALEEEWQLILQNAAPNARVLLRSAALELDFLPDFVRERVTFDQTAATSAQAKDRVGTYASTWIGTIHSNYAERNS